MRERKHMNSNYNNNDFITRDCINLSILLLLLLQTYQIYAIQI